jgi:hypothetical protein
MIYHRNPIEVTITPAASAQDGTPIPIPPSFSIYLNRTSTQLWDGASATVQLFSHGLKVAQFRLGASVHARLEKGFDGIAILFDSEQVPTYEAYLGTDWEDDLRGIAPVVVNPDEACAPSMPYFVARTRAVIAPDSLWTDAAGNCYVIATPQLPSHTGRSYVSYPVAVDVLGVTPTPLVDATKVGNVSRLEICNLGTETIYIGDAAVTTLKGTPLLSGQSAEFDDCDELYAVAESALQVSPLDTRVMALGVPAL